MEKGIVFLLTCLILLGGCSGNSPDKKLQISNSKLSIGAVNPDQTNFKKQKLTYEMTIKNPMDVKVVDAIDVIPAKVIKDRLIETKAKGIEYNEKTIKIHGQLIFDSKGLTKKEVVHFEPYIKGLQFIGDNNKEYLLVNEKKKDKQ